MVEIFILILILPFIVFFLSKCASAGWVSGKLSFMKYRKELENGKE